MIAYLQKIIVVLVSCCFVLALALPCAHAETKEEKIASLQSSIEAAKKQAAEYQRQYEYYRYRNMMAVKVKGGMSAGPGTHLGAFGETVEPIQPDNAQDEFTSSQELMNYADEMVKVSQAQAAKLEKDLVQIQSAPAVKAEAEPERSSEGGGY